MATLFHLIHHLLQPRLPVSSSYSSTRPQFPRKITRHHSHRHAHCQIQTLMHNIILSNNRFVPVLCALAESDSPKSIGPSNQTLLQELADSFDLQADYFSKLPRDLRLDLNDAAFDLSNGAVLDECGQALGQILLNLSRAWESADTSTSHALARKLPSMENSLGDRERSGKSQVYLGPAVGRTTTNIKVGAFGKRLISAGTRFQSMGLYGQGELQKIAESLITAGKALSASSLSMDTEEIPQTETRVFKFGELQVAVTPEKAIIGAAIGIVFAVLSWVIAQGIQSIPESSLQYANDSALLLAKSLRGALLAVFYSSTFLSAFFSGGLLLLAGELKSKE